MLARFKPPSGRSRSASATNTRADASDKMYCTSSVLKCQLIGHHSAPIQRAASITSNATGPLRINSATTSPSPTPAARKAPAARKTRW